MTAIDLDALCKSAAEGDVASAVLLGSLIAANGPDAAAAREGLAAAWRENYKRAVAELAPFRTDGHALDCQGSPVVLASHPPKDGGFIGCTCGADK